MIITYQKLLFTIRAKEKLSLPYYKGSTFRGGFGNVFRKVVCALKRQDCRECLLQSKCVYAYVFETAPTEDTDLMNMKSYEKIPHPFIIEPPEEAQKTYDVDDTLSFNLILIGRATEYLPYFIYTFDELGKTGIGKGRGKYQLQCIKADSQVIYDSEEKVVHKALSRECTIPEAIDFGDNAEETITVKLVTPMRISYRRELTSELSFHVLMRSLLRRLLLLYYFHCEKRMGQYDHKKIIQQAEQVSVEKNSLKWWDWERYSARQHTKMKMGGLIGEITYKGNIEPFLPVLRAGEVLHTGKGTGFGLGKFSIE